VDIEYLLENAVQFLDDFLFFFAGEGVPDLARGDFWTFGHDSYSFTRASNSCTADRQSLSQGVRWPKVKRLVAARGRRSRMPSRYWTKTWPSGLFATEAM
jgi:hypothetical protein